MERLDRSRPRPAKAVVEGAIAKLFAKQLDHVPKEFDERLSLPEITLEKIRKAGRKIADGIAPGPDVVPRVAVKLLIQNHPDVLRRLVESLFQAAVSKNMNRS